MGNSNHVFKTVVLENSTWAVVRTDPARPRFMEVIANFYDESRAKDYTDVLNGQLEQPQHEQKVSVQASAPARASPKPDAAEADLSSRQSAVLRALREKMDDTKHVAVRAAVLAQAAQIPLGSLHSVLGSLEKKGLIQTSRAGSARAPAVYRIL
jgi:predicted Rossmann fold nucleotide-binding protein DprA/Smf involved in DNA uptake